MLVEDMRAGRKTRKQMLEEVRKNIAKRTLTRIDGTGQAQDRRPRRRRREADDPAPDEGRADPLDDFKARRAHRRAAGRTCWSPRRSARPTACIRVNPDEAYEILKRTLDGVRTNTDLEPDTINGLAARLTQSMESAAAAGQRDQARPGRGAGRPGRRRRPAGRPPGPKSPPRTASASGCASTTT